MLYNSFTMLHVVFWSLVLLLALSFFGISIKAIMMSPAGQENVQYLTGLFVQGWQWLRELVHTIVVFVQSVFS